MRITLRSKNLTLTPALRTYIDIKVLGPVRKLLKDALETDLPVLDLEFSRTTRHHQKGKVFYAEANLTIGKRLLRAEVYDEDIRVCCDILKDELDREIRRFKNKAVARERRGARKAKKELRLDPSARLYRKGRMRQEDI